MHGNQELINGPREKRSIVGDNTKPFWGAFHNRSKEDEATKVNGQ